MLRQSCSLLDSWRERDLKLIPVSVNCSVQTLMEPGIISEICQIVDHYALPHNYVIIEITESMARQEKEKFATICNKLVELGFRLSLDDFCSEYAFVQMLTKVPFSIIKFDKSIIDNITTDKRIEIICKTLMRLCTQFGFKVLAEGVQTKRQLDLLKSYSCQLIQGFYFGKPMEITAFEQKHAQEMLKQPINMK